MINLILLFLMFNLSLEVHTVSTASVPIVSIDKNKPYVPDQKSLISHSVADPSIVELDSSMLATAIPATTKPNLEKKVPRQFSIQKINNSKPHKEQPQILLANSVDPKKPFHIHCRQCSHAKRNKALNVIKEKQITTDSMLCKHWNNNPNLVPTKPLHKPKKRVLIFMSKGGGGHISVSNALKSYLEDGYEITIANFFEDVMSSVDTVRYLTFGKASGEDIYNFCLQNRFISLVNGFTKFGAWTLRQKSTSIEPLIQDFIARHKPDLIISVIPVVNFILLPAAKKFGIPFLIVTNDLDTTNYINGITKIDYDKFYYTAAFNDRDIFNKFRSARIPKSQVAVTGFPLRPEFYDKNKNKALIKKDFNIPEDKQVVMILMGGAGSFVCYRYVQTLLRMKKSMHIVACIGRDERLRDAINGLMLPPDITLSVVGFTNRISDLMSVSNVLITKAGPNSICEAIASHLPILIDQTTGNIWWEVLNVDFVKKHKIGDTVTRFKEVNNKITKFLDDAAYIKSIKNRMAKIQAGIDFRQRIRCLIDRIVG